MGTETPPAGDPIATALDGATRDSAVSGDAMRWSPDLADSPPALPVGLAGAGEEGLAALQRLVTGAMFALPSPQE